MKRIASTAFYVSLASYFIFALADYVRPGFVSYVFSVHWFLLTAIVSGAWLMLCPHFPSGEAGPGSAGLPTSHFLGRATAQLTRAMVGLALLIVFWQEGEVFGDFQIFIACTAFFLPWLISYKLQPKP